MELQLNLGASVFSCHVTTYKSVLRGLHQMVRESDQCYHVLLHGGYSSVDTHKHIHMHMYQMFT